jgi:DNA-binding HxlR family transcriptional regulator
MKRVPFADMPCPVAQTLELVGEWWTLLIVREAFLGRRRFVEFQQQLGIARNVLSSRLRKLVAEGILERRASETDAREVEYRLTPKGKDLMPVLIALSQWGERWIYEGKSPLRYVHRHTGEELPRLAMRDAQGNELTPRDLRIVRSDGVTSGAAPRAASR